MTELGYSGIILSDMTTLTLLPSNERERFADRLIEALHQAGYPGESPAGLASEFNARFPQHAVTVHAARKWIKGEAIPTQEKIIDLSGWLGVSPGWLRFDADNELLPARRPEHFQASELRTLRDLQRLDAKGKTMVNQLLKLLLGRTGETEKIVR